MPLRSPKKSKAQEKLEMAREQLLEVRMGWFSRRRPGTFRKRSKLVTTPPPEPTPKWH